jgi:hypothetical protein
VKSPSVREMHSSIVVPGGMLIFGGRNEDGLLADAWKLELHRSSAGLRGDGLTVITGETIGDDEPPAVAFAVWSQCLDVSLPIGLCSHSSSLISYGENSCRQSCVAVFGGFRADGQLSSDLYIYDFGRALTGQQVTATASSSLEFLSESTGTNTTLNRWQVADMQYSKASSSLVTRNAPSPHEIGARFSCACAVAPRWLVGGASKCGIVLFGGMTAQQDNNDLWLVFIAP